MVASLPVIDILGRQVYVDAVFHDLLTDTIYIFTGMKFFTFRADEFKVSYLLFRLQSTRSSLHTIDNILINQPNQSSSGIH